MQGNQISRAPGSPGHARITKQMKKDLGVTEELKEKDQMKWVGLMNNIKASAEEIVLTELIRS